MLNINVYNCGACWYLRAQVTPDDPRLWNTLGDLHMDDSHYREAWERSGHRNARSQRSLGRRCAWTCCMQPDSSLREEGVNLQLAGTVHGQLAASSQLHLNKGSKHCCFRQCLHSSLQADCTASKDSRLRTHCCLLEQRSGAQGLRSSGGALLARGDTEPPAH